MHSAQERDPAKKNQALARRRILMDDTGQMSIFVALIFQILFVFFAMVINIGLLVHDKINLQNSVDLAAFYGAQKQAELLDEIAHINYQIRQDYKLLTWRYRVVGTLGRHNNYQRRMPVMTGINSPAPQDISLPSAPPLPSPDGNPVDEPPVVCVANEFWREFGTNSGNSLESYCRWAYNSTTPGIPTAQVLNPFLAINGVMLTGSKKAQQQLQYSCNSAAPLNWAFTMQMLYAYRQAIAVRKMMINSLRKNLISKTMNDIDNQSVETGVLKTLRKNLTKANLDGGLQTQILNGLTLGGCDAQDGEFMMPEISIAPLLQFMFSRGLGGAAGCSYSKLYHTQYDQIPQNLRDEWDPEGVMTKLSQGEPDPKDPLHSSLGYEKNPWCMVYYGVKARSAPRKPFAPFGQPVQLEARAFAQPFGGRIGPWYSSKWPRGAGTSNSAQDTRTDKLTTPRLNPGGDTFAYTDANLPNFSRFPGDLLGLKSQLAMAAQRHIFSTLNRLQGITLSLKYYAGFVELPTTGDPLLWDPNVPSETPLEQTEFRNYRRAELAAIAPDIFDATYYSIDPAYFLNFHKRHVDHPDRFALAPIFGVKTVPISDLGSRIGNAGLSTMQVDTQIEQANNGGIDPNLLQGLPWVIRSWESLLTGWAPNRAVNYDFPNERFGKCAKAATAEVMIPGKCAIGGRTGYSVRLISREHLLFDDWQIGGDGEAKGGLLNKPLLSF